MEQLHERNFMGLLFKRESTKTKIENLCLGTIEGIKRNQWAFHHVSIIIMY